MNMDRSGENVTGRENQKLFKIEYAPTTPITEILPIRKGGITISRPEDLEGVVEQPLLKSLQLLMKKGILSVQSSANGIEGIWFHLLKESMIDQNIIIAYDLGFTDNRIVGSRVVPTLYIDHDLIPEITFLDVENWSLELAEKFINQRFIIEQ